ncbi:MAG: DMT family transporter [Alphaproteobacteria bacterium]|nr:DMT family transporter [Alphaproteobacteria bacterium]
MRAFPAPHPSVPAAAAWMVGALMLFTLLGVASRELSYTIGVFQIMFFRYVFGFAITAPIVLRRGLAGARTGNLKVQLLRNVSSFVGSIGWFYGISVLPLTLVFAIEFTAPMFVALMAVWWLGERLTTRRIAAIVLGFVGVLVILRPGVEAITPAVIACLLGAIGIAGSHIGAKKLSAIDSPLVVVFYMNFIQMPMSAIPALVFWKPVGWYEVFWGLVIGASAVVGHFCLTRAFQRADATVVVPMDFLRVPLIAVIAWAVYAEAIDLWVLLGAAIIFGGNYLAMRSERRATRTA